ncbi:hypothetical protein HELRODRAFT_63917, partial [Helobdella robusta]|uniref:Large ribosomal subunit protein bL19m n=1 Tax=Helobdella robusta TaxID=6412 RepID=T1FXM5_HELRO
RYIFPEFLPNHDRRRRDKLAEMLERQDMFKRRFVINIPEFYVGSVMSVTVIDPHASNKESKFVGICIERAAIGLRANFTLRNIVDGQGCVEITYDLYCPLILKIEVLRLEKRLDNELFYLRDAPQEYSTFSFDMLPIQHPPNEPVPTNSLKVKLNPKPWHERWERQNLKGLQDLDLPQKVLDKAKLPAIAKPWDTYDLMKKYRSVVGSGFFQFLF